MTPEDRGGAPLQVAFVLAPDMLATGTALPYEMWLAALDRRRALRRPAAARLSLVAAGAAPCGRLPLQADCTLADSPQFDLVYLPALWRRTRAAGAASDAALGAWLVAQHGGGALVAAVSSGVGLLARAGLLDGRAATTHWYHFDRFEREFPRVDWRREFFITQSGALYCAASINSLADVTVHLIERFLDRATAHHVERNFSHEIRRTYEEYRYLDGGATPLHDETVVEAQLWIGDHLAQEVQVSELADRLAVARRTLERRFRAATGCSVRGWWQRERIRLAKELLERTDLSIGDIAWRVGYRDAGWFAQLFRREVSVAPLEYRRTVRAKLFRSPMAAPVKNVDKSPRAENS